MIALLDKIPNWLRWILFLPVFVVSLGVLLPLAAYILAYITRLFNPVNGLPSLLGDIFFVFLPFMLAVLYTVAIFIALMLAPNPRFGGYIGGGVVFVLIGISYITNPNYYQTDTREFYCRIAMELITLMSISIAIQMREQEGKP